MQHLKVMISLLDPSVALLDSLIISHGFVDVKLNVKMYKAIEKKLHEVREFSTVL